MSDRRNVFAGEWDDLYPQIKAALELAAGSSHPAEPSE
jgi:hypothetical protein